MYLYSQNPSSSAAVVVVYRVPPWGGAARTGSALPGAPVRAGELHLERAVHRVESICGSAPRSCSQSRAPGMKTSNGRGRRHRGTELLVLDHRILLGLGPGATVITRVPPRNGRDAVCLLRHLGLYRTEIRGAHAGTEVVEHYARQSVGRVGDRHCEASRQVGRGGPLVCHAV
jgi:hypothetical protein